MGYMSLGYFDDFKIAKNAQSRLPIPRYLVEIAVLKTFSLFLAIDQLHVIPPNI